LQLGLASNSAVCNWILQRIRRPSMESSNCLNMRTTQSWSLACQLSQRVHRRPGLLLGNQIIQLREWGTERAHPLPGYALRCRLGTEEDCTVRLSDPDVLPIHAQLTRERQRWLTRALGDTPGLLRDGARCDAFSLEPGVE